MKWLSRGLPRNVLALGAVSLLADVAGDMVSPLLPLFLVTLPGGGALALGWIEGVADALSSLLKLFAGIWSDRVRSRKPIVVFGYALAAAARPLTALAMVPWHMVAVRALDRAGKGVRTSPRDALLAASVPEERRGEAYGFHRAMDHTGAVIGPLVAVALLVGFGWELRHVFWVATLPGLLSVIVAACFVREERAAQPAQPRGSPPVLGGPLPPGFLRFLVPLAVFTLGNASDLFLMLLARDALSLEDSFAAVPLLWMALHIVKATSSIFAGRWSDRVGTKRVILLGWLYYAAVYTALALFHAPAIVVGLCIAYGLYHGLTEGAEKALVAQIADHDARGTAFGWYYLVVGVFALPASVMFGFLWSRYGSASAFLTSAALALIATAFFWLRPPPLESPALAA